MFARLDLDMQRRFDANTPGAVELCTDYLGAKRDQGETRWMTLEEFRTLLEAVLNPMNAWFRANLLASHCQTVKDSRGGHIQRWTFSREADVIRPKTASGDIAKDEYTRFNNLTLSCHQPCHSRNQPRL